MRFDRTHELIHELNEIKNTITYTSDLNKIKTSNVLLQLTPIDSKNKLDLSPLVNSSNIVKVFKNDNYL